MTIKQLVKCAICGKEFETRMFEEGQMHKHDSDGNKCSGSFYVVRNLE